MYTVNFKKLKKRARKGQLAVGRLAEAQPVVQFLTNAERVAWSRNKYKTNDSLWQELRRRATARATGRIRQGTLADHLDPLVAEMRERADEATKE